MPIFVGPNNNDSEIKSDRIGFAVSTTNPGSAAEGDSYFNSGDKQLKVYNGSGWDSVGAGGGTVEAVASGTLANGQTVILQTDGKVAGVVTTGIAQTNGTKVAFQGSGVSAGDIDAAYDTSAQKVVVAFRDNTNSSARNAQNAVITVNGTTVSWDSQEHNLMTQQSEYIGITYVPDQERTVSVWRDTAGGDRGYAYVVDVATNGTWTKASIDVEFAASGTDIQYPGIGYVGNSKVVVAYF